MQTLDRTSHVQKYRPRGGFTLIELIVVILILGVLAAIAVVGYGLITDRAEAARAQANLRSIAHAVIVEATDTDAANLNRTMVSHALQTHVEVTVHDGLSAERATWYLGHSDDVPIAKDNYALAFDNGAGAVSDNSGARAVVITPAGGNLYARLITWHGPGGPDGTAEAGPVPAGTTPTDILKDPSLIGTTGSNPGGGDAGDPATSVGSVVRLSGPTADMTGIAPAVFALQGVLLNKGGTVSTYSTHSNELPARVAGLSDVKQIAGSKDGGDPYGAGITYAVHTDGSVSQLTYGTVVAPVPELTGVSSIATYMEMATYAIHTDGTLTQINTNDATYHPVVGATDVAQVTPVSYNGFEQGFAVTAAGTAAYLLRDEYVPIEGLSNVKSITACGQDCGVALLNDGTLALINLIDKWFPLESGLRQVTVTPVNGVTNAKRLASAVQESKQVGVLTTDGRLLFVMADGRVADAGLTGITVLTAGASGQFWAVDGQGDSYEAYSDDWGTELVAGADPLGLVDLTQIAYTGAESYALRKDGTIVTLGYGQMTVFHSASGDNVVNAKTLFCSYSSCFAGVS